MLTLQIDALAASGIKLGRHYTYMWCSPSRAALLSGRLPVHTGVYQSSGAAYALGLQFPLLPQLLAPAGYVSHAIGKWCVQIRYTCILYGRADDLLFVQECLPVPARIAYRYGMLLPPEGTWECTRPLTCLSIAALPHTWGILMAVS